MQRAHRVPQALRHRLGGGEVAAAFQAGRADGARQRRFVRQRFEHAFAELPAQLGRDRVRVGAGLIEPGRVEVQFHRPGIETHRATESPFVGWRVRRARVGQQQLPRGQRRLEDARAEPEDRAEPELGGQRQQLAERHHIMALEDRHVAFDAQALLERPAGQPTCLMPSPTASPSVALLTRA